MGAVFYPNFSISTPEFLNFAVKLSLLFLQLVFLLIVPGRCLALWSSIFVVMWPVSISKRGTGNYCWGNFRQLPVYGCIFFIVSSYMTHPERTKRKANSVVNHNELTDNGQWLTNQPDPDHRGVGRVSGNRGSCRCVVSRALLCLTFCLIIRDVYSV